MNHSIGRITRLQVQTASLKQGEKPHQYFDPAPLVVVPALRLTAEGVVGLLDGQEVIDVHHVQHPARRRGSACSFNFTSHYSRMQAHFGRHLETGCAGENILIETDEEHALSELLGGLVVWAGDGRHGRLVAVQVAHPCLPFSRYALDLDGPAPDEMTKAALQFLDQGRRGFYGQWDGEPLVVQVGDIVSR